MTETILAVLITVTAQYFITKTVIKAERQKIVDQIRGEEDSRFKEKRYDRILEAVSELLTVSDPQSTAGVDYGRTVNLILRIQLMLNTQNAQESSLNLALNNLGFALQEYHPVRKLSIDDKSIETKKLLGAQDTVIKLTKSVLNNFYNVAT